MIKQNPISGKFESLPNSLGTSRNFRLNKTDDEKFIALAEKLGVRPGPLARQIIEEWLKANS